MLQRRMPGRLMGSVPLWGGGLRAFKFDPLLTTFTPNMDKRAAPGPFATAPIVQGKWDGSGTPDNVTMPRGNLISGRWYDNYDAHQGSVVFWITPEWDGNDGLIHNIVVPCTSGIQYLTKHSSNVLRAYFGGGVLDVDVSAWTAGTTYFIVFRWDSKNTLDGTNFLSMSINNVHTFGRATYVADEVPEVAIHIAGSAAGINSIDSIIEGLTIYRRPLFDGQYGIAANWDDSGPTDEIEEIYAAGSGEDPCLVTGSWDVVFCLPTNSTAEALVTGTGEAWSHPHASNELTDGFCQTTYGSSAWGDEGTPIVPYSVEFDGSATRINCGSDASIDDIQSGILYAEAWIRIGAEDDNKRVMVKGNTTTAGWVFNINSGTIQATIFCATDYATSQSLHSTVGMRRDDKWYHILMAYNNGGDRKIYFAVNGIWASAYDEQIAGNGAIVTDAALNLYLGFTDANTFEGAMGYARLSNVARWTVGTDFTPPSRLNPPGVDGNTKAQYNFRDGPGAVLLDETANNNDGTITPGSGGWEIISDMDIDSPGERIFNWGYVLGNDAVDEGIVETLSGLTPGENYVVRAVASIESASRGRPKIIVYDETNGAEITALEGPSYTGNHDGGAGVAALTDTTARFPQMLVGWTIYNITDGSSATITAISGDMQVITGALGGGTDNDWDIGDEYRIVPPGGPAYYDDYPWIETFTFDLPTIDNDMALANDCTSISVKLVNGVNEGVIKWHQVELLENLLDNPSLEVQAQIDASGYTLNIGSVASGALSDTYIRNGTYFEIQETVGTPATDIEFVFPAIDGQNFYIYGRYEGNIGHNVNVDTWNGVGWDNLGTLVHAVADALHSYALLAAHTIGGVVTVRVQHTSPGNVNHRFWFDKLWVDDDPWIPDGWTNSDLDTGDTEAEAVILHSGVGSIEFNAGAINEGISAGSITGVGDGTFFALGGWGYGDGSGYLSIGPTGANGELQDGSSNRYVTFDNSNKWNYGVGVERSMAANPTITVVASSGGTGDRFLDDVYMFILDDVSLTVTPASLANSAESGGLRVDGRDTCTQPIPAGILEDTSGWIKFRWIPRHDAADFVKFGFADAYIFHLRINATHYILLHADAANTIRLAFNDGGGIHTLTWICTGLISAGTEYLIEVKYNAVEMILKVDGVTRITIVQLVDFGGSVPNFARWGHHFNGTRQFDCVIKAP